jgi:UDP-N-acetylmuramate-alanine ligase
MLEFIFSLFIAKILKYILNLTKISSGTSIIGKIVLKICPNFLCYVNKYINTKINVTGTNGKTTTSGLISHLLSKSKKKIINNALGANMIQGVVNAFATTINPLKTYDYSVIESDEAYLERIYEYFDADYLLVTNLFRDQLDRYGELATTKNLIQKGIDKKKNLKLILNADDPLVSSFSGGSEHIYYGV